MTNELLSLLEIPAIDEKARSEAKRRVDSLTKPLGSLGRLEDLGVALAGMTGRVTPTLERKVIFTVAGDHGVVREGVSAFPQEVTAQMVLNFLRGGAAINVLARAASAEVLVVDAGVAADLPKADGLIRVKLKAGTENMAQGPAMSPGEAQGIVEEGFRLFKRIHAARAIDVVGLGEMGIGNTTASAALAAALLNVEASLVSGRGTGLTDGQLSKKIQVIDQALKLNRPDSKDPMDCLAKVGGFEIGCLAGITLAAASARVPVVMDGFISTVAAFLAYRISPAVKPFLIAAHRSVEPGHSLLLNALELRPLLELQMRLGEGTGAALAFQILEASVRILSEMATFSEAQVSEGTP
ncbi:MAG: nicotinate-nucleotide--dimethylbenzimidazole phosphoribosyltransferase [Candidatus Omnitrophica bacterium]|nr:nicotinate-nucleotide--dimethylbenzimidazole phosphoribosyltransferase [Candidatus Omnitrophota bacterium]